jgi:RNAse (barnase) inhibitor barstar
MDPFVEKIILLLLAALVSGFGIPYVLKIIEQRKLREQKKFEADLARQAKIIESQSKLLDDLSQLLWKWRYLAKKVVYYGAQENTERYNVARKQYEEYIWDILNEFRTEISKSRRLVSEHAYEKLDSLYNYIVGDIDIKITQLIGRNEIDPQESGEIAERFSKEVSRRLDDAIDDLAFELHLKVKA